MCYCVHHAEWEWQSGETSRSIDSTFLSPNTNRITNIQLEEYGEGDVLLGGMGTIVIILCYCVHAEWERQSGETSRSFDSTIPFYLRILLELLIYYLEEYG